MELSRARDGEAWEFPKKMDTSRSRSVPPGAKLLALATRGVERRVVRAVEVMAVERMDRRVNCWDSGCSLGR